MDIQKEAHIRVTTEAIAKEENLAITGTSEPVTRFIAEVLAKTVVGDDCERKGCKCIYKFDEPNDDIEEWVVCCEKISVESSRAQK